MKKNILKATALAAMATAIFFASCKKKEVEEVIPDKHVASKGPDHALYKTLLSVGFDSSEIKEDDYYYKVDDIAFVKHKTDVEEVKAYFGHLIVPGATPNARLEQWNRGSVSTDRVEYVKVKLPYGTPVSSWANSVKQAMKLWANVGNCKVNFSEVDTYEISSNGISSINYTVVKEDNGTLDQYTVANAVFPTSGYAGWQILINTDVNIGQPMTEAIKLQNMLHELGHCLGFAHSNWQTLGEQNLGYTQVPGTPATDANSVMNGMTGNVAFTALSSNDILAMRTLYPYQQYDQWITAPVGKYNLYTPYYAVLEPWSPITITWNTSLVSTPTVKIELLQYGNLKTTLATAAANTGSFTTGLSNYQMLGHYVNGLQIRITSNANTTIKDLSDVFGLFVD